MYLRSQPYSLAVRHMKKFKHSPLSLNLYHLFFLNDFVMPYVDRLWIDKMMIVGLPVSRLWKIKMHNKITLEWLDPDEYQTSNHLAHFIIIAHHTNCQQESLWEIINLWYNMNTVPDVLSTSKNTNNYWEKFWLHGPSFEPDSLKLLPLKLFLFLF